MSQFNKGTTYTDVSPGKTVTSTNLNAHVDNATALNGLILDQVEKTTTVAADCVLLGDSTLAASGIPKKVQLTNLLPETIRQGVQQYVASDTGSANAYAVALSPAATAYTAGMVVRFKAGNANTTASTINVNALGTKNIFTRAGAALAANDILANQIVELVYDGTQFQLVSAISAAEITATHLVEANRQSIHQYAAGGGTANAHTVTLSPAAAALTAGMIVRFKAGATNTGAATLAVNGLTATAIKRVVAGAVADLAANDIQTADLVTVTYDGTQFLLSGRVRSWDYVGTAGATLAAGTVQFAHGLGAVPTKVRAVFVNTTAQGAWGLAAEIDLLAVQLDTGGERVSVWSDATNINVGLVNTTELYAIASGTTRTALTAGSWKIKVYASL